MFGYHEPNNEDRAGWARATLEHFAGTVCRTDDEDALADFLCDAMHLCEREPDRWGGFEDAVRRAQSNYEAERTETGGEKRESLRTLLPVLRALTDWAREHTSPKDANSPHSLLVAAQEAIIKAEAGR